MWYDISVKEVKEGGGVDWKEKQQGEDGIIEGRNAVLEALRVGTAIEPS